MGSERRRRSWVVTVVAAMVLAGSVGACLPDPGNPCPAAAVRRLERERGLAVRLGQTANVAQIDKQLQACRPTTTTSASSSTSSSSTSSSSTSSSSSTTSSSSSTSSSTTSTTAGIKVSVTGFSTSRSATDKTVLEATFTVTLSGAATSTVTVDWATQDVTATAGVDYEAGSGTLSFSPGTTSLLGVVRYQDDCNKAPLLFSVKISNASGASIGSDTALGETACFR